MRMHLRSVALNILLPSQIHSSIPPAMPCSIAMPKFYANSNRTYWQMIMLTHEWAVYIFQINST